MSITAGWRPLAPRKKGAGTATRTGGRRAWSPPQPSAHRLPRSPLNCSGLEVPWLRGFGARKRRGGLPVVAQQERGHGEITPGRRVAGFGPDRFTVRDDGLLVPARGIEGDAEVVARIGIDGAELSGSLELVDRGPQPPWRLDGRDQRVQGCRSVQPH